jgi:hypothetical protein
VHARPIRAVKAGARHESEPEAALLLLWLQT